MGHTVIDAADVEPSFGVFRKMRHALGATGGSGAMRIDGKDVELVTGRWLARRRRPHTHAHRRP
jgi:hypothetical protein